MGCGTLRTSTARANKAAQMTCCVTPLRISLQHQHLEPLKCNSNDTELTMIRQDTKLSPMASWVPCLSWRMRMTTGPGPCRPPKQCLRMHCCAEARQTSSLELPQRRSARAMALGTPICSCMLRIVSWIVSSPCNPLASWIFPTNASQNTINELDVCKLARWSTAENTRSQPGCR